MNYIAIIEPCHNHIRVPSTKYSYFDGGGRYWMTPPPCEHLAGNPTHMDKRLTPSNVFPSVIPHNPKQYGPLRRRTEPCPKSTPRSRT